LARKIAVVLFNLGGPDSLRAVRPFLFNLFNDGAIIRQPQPLRALIAFAISAARAKLAKANYEIMGGRSPLLPETQAQAAALGARLVGEPCDFRVFIAMRYWKPFAADAAEQARAWGAEDAILVPLYPQFSTTTTGSAIAAWRKEWPGPTHTLCCMPTADDLASAHAERILEAWREGGAPPNPRVLFSAHGLPKQIVEAGDPYQWQVEQTVAAVRAKLPGAWQARICYQSRVGPLEWIGPSTEEEIDRAIADRAGLIVSPIAFVSEHVETLVELDRDYAARAKPLPFYLRAKTLGVADSYISLLAAQVRRIARAPSAVSCEAGARLCPRAFDKCPLTESAS
jgi:ferrochelatase